MKKNLYYLNTGTRAHTCLDGRVVTLFVWRAFCKVCDAPFEVMTPPPDADGRVHSKAFERVHCDKHKRGVRRCVVDSSSIPSSSISYLQAGRSYEAEQPINEIRLI